MGNTRRWSLLAILAPAVLLTLLGAVHAGTITGKLYDADGTTQLTAETITIQVIDSAGTVTTYGGSYTNGTYSINITTLAPADKTVTFKVTRGGQVKRTLSGLAGNIQTPQTIHITAPK